MAQAPDKPSGSRDRGRDYSFFPRIQTISHPSDVAYVKYSSFNQQRRSETGWYRGRNFGQKSQLSDRLLRLLDPLKTPNGRYVCPFCRGPEAYRCQASWDDVLFMPSLSYTDITTLDDHVLAYHMPFIRYYACPCEDDFASLSLIHI